MKKLIICIACVLLSFILAACMQDGGTSAVLSSGFMPDENANSIFYTSVGILTVVTAIVIFILTKRKPK